MKIATSARDVFTIVLLIIYFFWVMFIILSAAFEHSTKVEPIKTCVTESGHKKVPCPETNDLVANPEP